MIEHIALVRGRRGKGLQPARRGLHESCRKAKQVKRLASHALKNTRQDRAHRRATTTNREELTT